MTKLSNMQNQSDSLSSAPRRRGRPKCFNEQQALERAMLLFWQYGYEATSISDLTQALNITAPSLYGSFGDKTALFAKCLDYYAEHEACPIDSIFKSAKTAKIAVELFIYENIKRLAQENKPSGCMMIMAGMNCSEQNQQIQENLKQKRLQVRAKLEQRILHGQKNGEFPESVNTALIADFYCTMLQGMSIQARDGASAQTLESIAQQAMLAWDHLVST